LIDPPGFEYDASPAGGSIGGKGGLYQLLASLAEEKIRAFAVEECMEKPLASAVSEGVYEPDDGDGAIPDYRPILEVTIISYRSY
jgi:hypothetical protein